MLKVGSQAPDFDLMGHDGKMYSLKDFNNQKLIIYFYPKDDTPGCTIQAIDFTAKKNEFLKLGYLVVGISKNSYDSHCKFIEKHKLDLILLSDSKREAIKAYGVEKKIIGTNRSTFVLDTNHKIVNVQYSVKANGHADKLIQLLKN